MPGAIIVESRLLHRRIPLVIFNLLLSPPLPVHSFEVILSRVPFLAFNQAEINTEINIVIIVLTVLSYGVTAELLRATQCFITLLYPTVV